MTLPQTLNAPTAPTPDQLMPWQRIYNDLLANADFGDVITFEQLDESLGRPFRDSRSPLYSACNYLGRVRHRWLTPVQNVGYRVLFAWEHTDKAKEHEGRALSQIEKAAIVLEGADKTALSDEQVVLLEAAQQHRAGVAIVLSIHSHYVNRFAKALQAAGIPF